MFVYARTMQDERAYLADMARLLDRSQNTIRAWVHEAQTIAEMTGGVVPADRGLLPKDLWPEREGHGRRRVYWSSGQVGGMRAFAQIKDSRKGWKATA